MAYLEEGRVCSFEEYTSNIDRRIIEAELELNGLYTYMMRLKHDEYKAAKQAVRVEEVQKKSGLMVVRFAFLDVDLFTEFVAEEPIQDGLIQPAANGRFVLREGPMPLVDQAYLRDYFEDVFGEAMLQADELCLT